MCAGMCDLALRGTKRDPDLLPMLHVSLRAQHRYELGKRDAVDVETVPC
jgi:hypothetical protein